MLYLFTFVLHHFLQLKLFHCNHGHCTLNFLAKNVKVKSGRDLKSLQWSGITNFSMNATSKITLFYKL